MNIYSRYISRGCGVTKNTVLTKKIMLNVAGWGYIGRCFPYEDFNKPNKERRWGYMVYNPKGERVLAATTKQGIDDFCLGIYKDFYENHPEEQDWLPNPYRRKKIVSKIITVE